MNPEWKRFAYIKVAVGSSVQTLDGEAIGSISEIRGDYFRIKTSWRHRDFWLRADSVRTAEAGQGVVLNVDKAELEGIKILDEPERA